VATTPFRYGRFIGRVGGLAVALGIGAAIANSPAIANADDGKTSASDAGSSNSGSSSSATSSSASKTHQDGDRKKSTRKASSASTESTSSINEALLTDPWVGG
jgi:hypothetical protein